VEKKKEERIDIRVSKEKKAQIISSLRSME
jgi:hypothetical protein